MTMGIKSEVGRWFGFAHILVFWALEAIAQVDAVGTFAVQEVSDVEYLPCLIAGESLG